MRRFKHSRHHGRSHKYHGGGRRHGHHHKTRNARSVMGRPLRVGVRM